MHRLTIVKRLAYDENYQRAIELLTDILETQNREIQELKQVNQNQFDRIQKLEYKTRNMEDD